MCAYHSPQLFAVDHVLLRLLMPRHSPCALAHFTSCKWVLFAFSQNCSFPTFVLSNFVALLIVSYLHLFLYSVFKLLFCIRFRKHRSESTSSCQLRSALAVGTSGLEPPTSRLSGVRSDHLSYAPFYASLRSEIRSFP